jgi:hypothetical protein
MGTLRKVMHFLSGARVTWAHHGRMQASYSQKRT